MLTYINAEDVVEVVQSMETVKSAGIHNVTFGPYQLNTVSFAGTTAEQTQQLCFPGEKRLLINSLRKWEISPVSVFGLLWAPPRQTHTA